MKRIVGIIFFSLFLLVSANEEKSSYKQPVVVKAINAMAATEGKTVKITWKKSLQNGG